MTEVLDDFPKKGLVNKILVIILLYALAASWSASVQAQCSSDSIVINDTLRIDPMQEDNLPTLMVHAKGVKAVKLLVYSKKGSKVFESTSSVLGAHSTHYKTIDTGWDGTRMGQMLQAGLYVFMLEAQCVDGQTLYKNGTVQLLRPAVEAPEAP